MNRKNQSPKNHYPCYLCGASRHEPWATEAGYHAVRCADCKLVYVSDRPGTNEISDAVALGMHGNDAAVLKTTRGRINKPCIRLFKRRLLQLTENRLAEAKLTNWLDVGAGYGEFALAVREMLGHAGSVEGIEPCAAKARWAEANHGLIREGRKLEDCPGPYDGISLMNVISHVPDPTSFVSQLSARIRPGGLLVLETGNGAELSRKEYPGSLFLPDHLAFFGEAQLRQLLSKSGLKLLKVDRHHAGDGRLPLIPFLRNKAMNTVRRLRQQPINRVDWSAYRLLPRRNQRFSTLWLLAEKDTP
jgi:SAM-dependent methyltransferase